MPWWAPGCPHFKDGAKGEGLETMSPEVKRAHEVLKKGVFAEAAQAEAAAPVTKPKCPMCVCKELRGQRDLCMLNTGEEAQCAQQIDELNACLLSYGFDMGKKKT